MSYSSTVRNGSARDEALKRRSGAVREALGMTLKPKQDTAEAVKPRVNEKPDEPRD